MGKVANQAKLAILSHFCGKRLEKLQIGQNWLFLVIVSHFGGERLEKLRIGQNRGGGSSTRTTMSP